MLMNFDLTNALISLYPNSLWVMIGDTYDGLEWNDEQTPKPSEKELLDEIKRLQQEYDLKEYQRQRIKAYPSIQEQLDLIYHEGIDVWKEKIEEIKNTYPKL
jgi:hypothetical protein